MSELTREDIDRIVGTSAKILRHYADRRNVRLQLCPFCWYEVDNRATHTCPTIPDDAA